MCGIYGIISRTNSGLSHEDDEILKQMMLDTVQRGDNSSGLFMTYYLDPHVEPTGVKVLGGPHNIIYNTPLWREVGNFIQRHAGAVIGHGRWATRGKGTAENAHPFQHEDITLVHNGTVVAGKKLMIAGEANYTMDQDHDFAVAVYNATATAWDVLVPGSGGGSDTLDTAYTAGHTVEVDAGPIILHATTGIDVLLVRLSGHSNAVCAARRVPRRRRGLRRTRHRPRRVFYS